MDVSMITFYSDDVFSLIYNSQHTLSTIAALCLYSCYGLFTVFFFCVSDLFFFSIIVWLKIFFGEEHCLIDSEWKPIPKTKLLLTQINRNFSIDTMTLR